MLELPFLIVFCTLKSLPPHSPQLVSNPALQQKMQRVGGPEDAPLLPVASVSNAVRSEDPLLLLMSSLLLSQFRT